MPCTNAAAVVAEYAKTFGDQDVQALMEQLRPHMNSVNNGDLQHCESMLVGQAHALQSIFMNLSRRAVNQEYLKQYEMYLRLPAPASHAEKNINQQNELLEVQHGSETMDTRATGEAIGKNPAMATVD